MPEDEVKTIAEISHEHFGTVLNAYYAIFIAIWVTLLVESWKRKQNSLANNWLMRDFYDATLERTEFRATYNIDVNT